MKLHEDADRLAKMKQQLASSELRAELERQGDRIEELEKQIVSLQSVMGKLIRKMGPSGR